MESEQGEFALIHDASEIKYEVYRNCNLTEVGELFAEQPYSVAVQQGSQLNEEISRRYGLHYRTLHTFKKYIFFSNSR